MTKILTHKKSKPSSQVILFQVLRYDNLGQLTIPNLLNLGNDGKLYLTHIGEAGNPKAVPQPISLKESIAWFRLGHDYNLSLTKGDSFGEWLKMIEQGLS